MVYMKASVLGYRCYVESWIQRILQYERHLHRIQSLLHKYLDPFIDFKHQSLKDREI